MSRSERTIAGLARIAVSAWLVLLGSSALAADPLRPFEAQYRLSRAGVELGTVHMRLRRNVDGSYEYRAEIVPNGLIALFGKGPIVERSRWRYRQAQVVPLEYDLRRGGDGERDVHATFDWKQGRVLTRAKGRLWSLQVPPGTLDKLLTNLVFVIDLRAGKDEHRYLVADADDLHQYEFTRIGLENRETVLGEFETVQFQRRKLGKRAKTTLWCAPALDYLPVHVERRDDGAVYRLALLRFERDDIPRLSNAGTPSPRAIRDRSGS